LCANSSSGVWGQSGGEAVTGAEDRPDGGRRRSNFGVVGRLAIGVLFFCVLTPLGLVLRLAGRDALRLRLDRRAPSYWIERASADGRQTSMEKQF
jgi:hypothetical protein